MWQLLVIEFTFQGSGHVQGDKLLNALGIIVGDLLHQGGAGEKVPPRWHEKDGLDFRIKIAVHLGHLKLEFKVGNRPQAPDEDAGALASCKVDDESIKTDNFNIGFRQVTGNELHAFVDTEKRVLVGIVGNANNYLVKDVAGAVKNIQVTASHWVESSWVDGFGHNILMMEE